MPTRNRRARGLAETADTARPRLAKLRGLATVTITVALICTPPAFAGGCKTGVRTGSEMVIGERKRPPAGMLTPAQAARRVRVYDLDLIREIRAGRLKHMVHGGKWWIPADALEAWRRSSWAIALVEWRKTKTTQLPWKTAPAPQHSETQQERSQHNETKSGIETGKRHQDTFPPVFAVVEPEYISRHQAAIKYGVHVNTIDNWHRAYPDPEKGGFDYYENPVGRTVRIKVSEIEAFWRARRR